jgi:4-hydroxy 2-oxovalerate aldolase
MQTANKILVSDPTLRDGNHAVRHQLKIDDIAIYCKAADDAGIPIVEVGHGNGLGASSLLVGKAAVSDDKILSVSRENLKKSKLGIHVIPGFCTIKSHLSKAVDLGVDVFRIASHCTEADLTKRHIEYVKKSDRTAYGVLMMSHMASVDKLVEESKKMESYGADGIVIMDSSGNYIQSEVEERISALVQSISVPIGFHGHNNLSLAVANSISAIKAGAMMVDGTVRGFGAGAGNTQLEALVAVMHRMGYDTGIDLYKLLDLADLVKNQFNPEISYISPVSIVSGLSGVFSGFIKPVYESAKQYQVDPRDIFFELGKRNAVAGQESLIVQVAQDLAEKNSKKEYHFF